MLRIAVLVSGGGSNLQAIIDAVNDKTITNTDISCVISNKKDVYALTRAEQNNIPNYTIIKKDFSSHNAWEEKIIDTIKENKIDLIVLAGFTAILSEEFIKAFPEKIINVHPSLIPAFCGEGFYGLKVHEKALEKGVKVSGATVHYVNEVVDGGKIITQKAVEVLDDDTPETLQKRIMQQAEWIILPQAINKIAQGE